MKTDRTAMMWGTLIGVALVTAMVVSAFDFPNFRLPFSGVEIEIFLVTALIFGMLIASYRKLWKIFGFWVLLVGFFAAHIVFCWLVVTRIAAETRGFRMDVTYGVLGGVEGGIFALIVLRVFHRGPDTRSFTRK
jgi:hypothetical protein